MRTHGSAVNSPAHSATRGRHGPDQVTIKEGSQGFISNATEIELSGLSQRVTALHGAVVTGAADGAIAEV